MTQDPFALQRFVDAQSGCFDEAISELRTGHKRTHWMWFVFPQLRGLGRSPTAMFYGLASLDEARAYLAHPLLGPRLREATNALLSAPGHSLKAILGAPDDLKFRSCMTLFALAAEENDTLFSDALRQRCGGRADEATLALIESLGRGRRPPHP
ncbi:DUF1810 domain-containing protein [uncultured Nitratireductor sp.]|uniref:DUF1810 domain-containing protein n=1 Tax=uncultured Nitratireductor sp. TaxID=520953 RepID=UPI0025E67BF1|nr:DUF1810 domain-containing protein [uncultured Nitratireductor sp.]